MNPRLFPLLFTALLALGGVSSARTGPASTPGEVSPSRGVTRPPQRTASRSTSARAGLSAGDAAVPGTPLLEGADPHVAVFGNRYWLYMTTGDSANPTIGTFHAYSSTDFKQWKKSPAILDLKTIEWVRKGAPVNLGWAPAIARGDDGKYYFYYSLGPQDERNKLYSRIGVAVGDGPGKPFTDLGKLLPLEEDNSFEAIDPMVFKDPRSGNWYLYAGGSAGDHMECFELAPGLDRLGRRLAVPRIINAPRGSSFTEGPFVHFHKGTYYLSYSHGGWNRSNYSAHYATGPSATGPWTYGGQILRSKGLRKGPGHHSFFRHPKTKNWYIVYHYWYDRLGDGPFGGARSIGIERVRHKNRRITLTDIENDDLPPPLTGRSAAR